jgi:DNA mismatch repair protein MutL
LSPRFNFMKGDTDRLQITLILTDIIHLLPDNIANQIAAGEVIQRPASAVKELLENAVDAGADEIKLYVIDAGKSLVQVVDNGKGMSETDARMAFERHATSKITQIDDLFRIKTMGFRGEALASIAAVAQVELKTRRAEDAAGTQLQIENSKVVMQEPAAVNTGTSIAMKNLFFNVPARRNFLKSNTSELRHIVDEFTRVAMAFPDVFFSLYSNGQEVFHLPKGNLKQRIVQILGNHYNAKLVPVHEETDYLNITGFVGKPETAKKTRGDQFLFVNNRFIKSSYLNHSIMNAFAEMVPKESFPMYALFIDLDPAQVDINVHPTKQEIKFDDEKIVYAFVQSAVKHALAQFSITPTLDFELDPNMEKLDAISKPVTDQQRQQTASSSLFRTFTQKGQAHRIEGSGQLKHWKDFYEPVPAKTSNDPTTSIRTEAHLHHDYLPEQPMLQLHQSYIVVQKADGFMVIHQQNAHERILFEKYEQALLGVPMPVQQSLFPATIDLSPADALILTELLSDMKELGYHIEPFGKNSFVIQGTPADVMSGNEKNAIEQILEQFKHFSSDLKFSKREKLLRSMSAQHAVKPGTTLGQKEMQSLVKDLFDCTSPLATPSGKPTFMNFQKDELNTLFGR